MKHLEVVAAAIEYDHKILCMQRNKAKYDYISYKFEFPGGKVEPGESLTAALERELREELDIKAQVRSEDHLLTVEHSYPDFSVTLHLFHCQVKAPSFVMQEHLSFQWLPVQELQQLDWVEADRPIVKYLQERLK